MDPRDAARFSPAWQLLHWLVALLVIAELALGEWMSDAPSRELRRTLLSVHESNGLVIWLLAAVRIVWRWRTGLPPWPVDITAPQRRLLLGAEGLLYLAMLTMPLSGLSLVMAAGWSISFFGWFEIAGLLPESELWHERLEGLHHLGSKVFLAVILGHAASVLYLDRRASRGFLRRMWPGRSA